MQIKNQQKVYTILLEIITFTIGITAVIGGIGLITTNGLGMPLSYLSNSVFPSFVIPGILLAGVVGGSNLLALLLLLRKHKYMLEGAAVGGFGIIIWIFGELYIIGHAHVLQAIYFALGVAMLIMIMLLQKSYYHEKLEIK